MGTRVRRGCVLGVFAYLDLGFARAGAACFGAGLPAAACPRRRPATHPCRGSGSGGRARHRDVEGQAGQPDRSRRRLCRQDTTTGSKTDTPLGKFRSRSQSSRASRWRTASRSSSRTRFPISAGVTASPWGLDDRFDECLIRGFDSVPRALSRRAEPAVRRLLRLQDRALRHAADRGAEGPGLRALRRERRRRHGQRRSPSGRRATPIYEGFASYGSFDTFEAGVDVGGPIDEAGVWSLSPDRALPRRRHPDGLFRRTTASSSRRR